MIFFEANTFSLYCRLLQSIKNYLKTQSAFFLSLLFLFLITIPTIIVVTESNVEVASVIDLSEDEENKNEELEKDIELNLPIVKEKKLIAVFTSKKSIQTQNFINCQGDISNKKNPPPEFIG